MPTIIANIVYFFEKDCSATTHSNDTYEMTGHLKQHRKGTLIQSIAQGLRAKIRSHKSYRCMCDGLVCFEMSFLVDWIEDGKGRLWVGISEF